MRQSFSSAMPETGNPAALTPVALHAVTRVYRSTAGPVTALAGVTASFAAGTFTAVMGPSGSGKSTLLHCAAGLDRPTSGEVILAGTVLRGLSETKLTLLRRRHVGFVFQSFNLLPYLTAGQNVALPLRLAGRRPRRGETGAALAAVGLDGRAGHRPAELSGGQQQRVAIARALVTGPQVIFADEPTGMLDSASGHEVLSLLRRLADQQQATVVMVTHDPAAAARADRVLFLADGRLAGDLADPDPRTVADRLAGLTADAGLRAPDGPYSPDGLPPGGRMTRERAVRGLGPVPESPAGSRGPASRLAALPASPVAPLFVSVIVLAGTFGYAVAARRRELGLLRTTGATPRQVRRLVLGEALITGAAGSAAGTALGPVIAGPFAALLARERFAPAGLTVHVILWPLAAAFGAGLLIALGGALAAARRAGRTRPAEALREAGRDRRVMTAFRWAAGPAALAGAAVLFAVLGGMHSADGEALVLPIVLLLILGAALLLPTAIRPLAGLIAALPLAGSRGAAWRLARSAVAGNRRRTAAVLAPVLLTVAFAGAMTAGFGTFAGATHRAAATRVTAPYVATARVGAGFASTGLAGPAVARLAAAPGVAAAVPAAVEPVYVPAGGEPDQWTGEYVPGPQAARVLRLPVLAGSLAGLTGTGTVAVPAGRWRVGQTAQLWLGDSAPVRLRVVAVYASQLDLSQTVLLPWALHAAHTGTPLASAVYLRLDPGASLAGVRAAAQAAGAAIAPTARYLAAGRSENDRVNRMAMLIVLGLALLYTAVGIANTLVMTIGDRRTELAVLRLSGATRGQVLRMLAAEATLTTAAAVLLAGLVIAVTAVGVRAGLAETTPAVPLDLPWAAAGGVAGACLLIALTATLIPAALALRERPAAAAGLAA